MRRLITLCLCLAAAAALAKPIRVVVWDEQQPAQKKAYTNFLGHQIATHLRTFTNFSVKSVHIDEPEQGLAKDTLDNCDVLIWWGHVRHKEISNDTARDIVRRIRGGQLAFIALHSAHWAEPFVEAMRERTRLDAQKQAGPNTRIEYITPERFRAPKAGEPLTPSFTLTNALDGAKVLRVVLPNCVFPAWRNDGAQNHMDTVLSSHPIARGIPGHFHLPQTEMYSDPFHVPKPDAVIFQEKWDKGESFRSGLVWDLGQGKVFYFRPGHEDYPIFTQAIPLRIISNAVEWLGSGVK